MKKVIRLNEVQLRQLIEELNESFKTEGPVRDLVTHLEGAKQALSELFQAATDKKAADQAQTLLNGLTRIIKAVNQMPELTGDKLGHIRREQS